MNILSSIKSKIFNIIRDDDENDLISNIFDTIVICIIIINVVSIIAYTFTLPDHMIALLNKIELISVIFFTIEYILRIWTADLTYPNLSPAKARLKYLKSFMALIDLVSILPFYLPFIFPSSLLVLRSLRAIRLLRIFKFNRYVTALSSIGQVFKENKHQLISSIIILALLMIIASVLMYNVESEAQPEVFSNAFSSLWWIVTTLTTIGYGDIYPVTTLGKILSEVISLLGVAIVAIPTGIISAGFIEQNNKKDKDCNKKYCPYCGKNLND